VTISRVSHRPIVWRGGQLSAATTAGGIITRRIVPRRLPDDGLSAAAAGVGIVNGYVADALHGAYYRAGTDARRTNARIFVGERRRRLRKAQCQAGREGGRQVAQ